MPVEGQHKPEPWRLGVVSLTLNPAERLCEGNQSASQRVHRYGCFSSQGVLPELRPSRNLNDRRGPHSQFLGVRLISSERSVPPLRMRRQRHQPCRKGRCAEHGSKQHLRMSETELPVERDDEGHRERKDRT